MCLKKLYLSILHRVCLSLSTPFKKDNVKNIANRESGFNYDSKRSFYRFYKEYNEFEEMSLNSKYNKMKKFTNLLAIFKNLKPKNSKTQLKKEPIIKNVDERYRTLIKMIMTLMI